MISKNTGQPLYIFYGFYNPLVTKYMVDFLVDNVDK